MSEPLLDDDGENRAVRAFLMMYGEPGLTVAAMRVHMTRCGFPHWPEWVTEGSTSHLTKAGAQLWLRHLFALEDAKPVHSDDAAVDRFAVAMKSKMALQREKGYSGWDDPSQCSAERLQMMLADHVQKGDPVDVGNFAMMLFNRVEPTTKPASSAFASIRVTIGAHHAEVEITRDQLVRARGQSEYVEMRAISAAIKCVRDAQAAGTI